jgi:hypothetical protein
MDIPQQILKQYGQAFSFGLFAPTTAKVEVVAAGFPAFQTLAGVYVGPDAKAWIWLSPDKAHPLLLQSFLTAQVGEISVIGEFGDGRSFSAKRCATAHVNSSGAGGFISIKDGKMIANITGPTSVMTNLLVLSPLVVRSQEVERLDDVSPLPGKSCASGATFLDVHALALARPGTIRCSFSLSPTSTARRPSSVR